MPFSEKVSSPTVPTDHEPDRLNRLVASVPEAMRSRRRKGFAAKHDLVEVHGNRVGPPSRWPLRANMRVSRTAKPQRNGNGNSRSSGHVGALQGDRELDRDPRIDLHEVSDGG